MEDLQDITLVGWSYGDLVTAGVLPRIEHRIKSIIYLDAFLPENGRAIIDSYPSDRRAGWRSIEGTIPRFLHFRSHSLA
jgi:pimeloyl-ACP methyl ester carboxylesterase